MASIGDKKIEDYHTTIRPEAVAHIRRIQNVMGIVDAAIAIQDPVDDQELIKDLFSDNVENADELDLGTT